VRLCVILSFERFKDFPKHNCTSVCVINVSACVVYASNMLDHARDTRRPPVLMRRNWFETAHVHVRPLTHHLRITHEQRTYHVYSTNVREACVFGRAPSVIHVSGVRRMFVEYYTVFARMRRRARYVSDCTCTVYAWFVSNFCPRKFGHFLDAQTQSVYDLWVIRAWSAVWLVLYMYMFSIMTSSDKYPFQKYGIKSSRFWKQWAFSKLSGLKKQDLWTQLHTRLILL